MKTMHKIMLLLVLAISCHGLQAQGIPSRNEAKIDQVQMQYGLSGKGVLTIMMDRGIDYRHPDFIDANGKTRIAYIYDLHDDSGANDPDNPFGVGTIFDSTEINASLQSGGAPLTNDIFGHGTATTGIMSGNGSGFAGNDQFKGVAHEAKIISIVVTKDFVPPFGNNPGQPGAWNPNLLTYGFQFAEQKISELGMPSVTLLNVGSIGDPTDGSVEFCNLVSSYVANGHPFVCGVGDDGGNDNHLITTLTQNQATTIQIEKGDAGNLRFTGWYSETDRFLYTIKRPGGQVEGPFASPVGPSASADHFLNQINIYHRGADVEFANSSANIRQLLIDFFGETGIYEITITPSLVLSDGTMNAFLNPSRYNNNNSFLNNTNPGGSINAYSACPESISPGDYVAINTWTDVNGVPRVKLNEGLPGELWAGSSIGPTMDGRLGIDLVAPGEIAWAAYSNDSYYGAFDFNVLLNSQGLYGIQTAVSAAAPIVSGVIALMLEVNPALTPAQIKTILQETARKDNFTGSSANARWGHGKLDALAAVNRVYQTVSTDDPRSGATNITVSPNPAADFIEIALATPGSDLVNGALFAFDGRKVMDFTVVSGEKVNLTGLPGGAYILHLFSDKYFFEKKIIKK